VVSTLLTYLELDGILLSTGPLYNEYKFQPQTTSKEMLAKFDPDRAALLRRLFVRAQKARTWFTLDIGAAAVALGEPRQHLVAALNDLEEQGDLIVKVAGLRHGFRLLTRPSDPGALAERLHTRFKESESRDIARIRQIVELATSRDCLVTDVLRYFGEVTGERCGHCDRCAGEIPPERPATTRRKLDDADLDLLRQLKAENHPALKTPRQRARFLCGIASPAASQAKLTQDPRFGHLASRGFAAVAKAAGK